MPEGVEMFSFFDVLFGCLHKHCSFPITVKPGKPHSNPVAAPSTYVVCLDCGRQFDYDWTQMKVVATVKHAA
jgi:DNA-directed RNA polymerase subunit RPC12/RpoP